jgi:hypothetical protein
MAGPFPEDKHESETALDAMYSKTLFKQQGGMELRIGKYANEVFDAIIDNKNMSIEEQNKAVLELVTSKGWI